MILRIIRGGGETQLVDNIESVRYDDGKKFETLRGGKKEWELWEISDIEDIYILNDMGKVISTFSLDRKDK